MKDEQFNLLVDLIGSVQGNLIARMERIESKVEDVIAEQQEMKTEQQEMKNDIKGVKKEQKNMKGEIKNIKTILSSIEETIKENAIINRKQHAFMIDLIQKQKISVN